MPNESNRAKGPDGFSGWSVIGGLFALGILGKTIEFLAGQIANQGPSGAYALGALGLAICGAFTAVVIGPVGRAMGKRILEGRGGASDEEVQELRLQVEELRLALGETQERIDFTERMLAGGKERVPEELH